MINNPELIKQVIDNIKKLSKEDLDKVMKKANEWYNKEVTDTNIGNIENLKTLLFQENLTQYGKRKLIEYYEGKIKELEAKLEFKQFGDLDNIQFEDYMNEFIPKQKIKDKIEELKKEHKKIEQISDFIIADTIQPKIEILEKLLEDK